VLDKPPLKPLAPQLCSPERCRVTLFRMHYQNNKNDLSTK
jgi:hypothetical protein